MVLRHVQIQKVLSEVVELLTFFFCFVFLVDEGREDPNTTISVSLSAASETPFIGVSLAVQ